MFRTKVLKKSIRDIWRKVAESTLIIQETHKTSFFQQASRCPDSKIHKVYVKSPSKCPEEIISKTNGFPCTWIPPHCYLLPQTLSQCNKTNISHLTRDTFPLGFKIHWPQLARPEEILIRLSQDVFCKESGPAKWVSAPGGSLLLLLACNSPLH